MTTTIKFGLRLGVVAAALLLSACAQPTAPLVSDPYAGRPGGGAVYSKPLPDGELGGAGTAAYFKSTVGDTILFTEDQSVLTDDARAALIRQADWLNRYGDFAALVQGHADEQGTREYNLALGARRAGAVQEYLVSKGVAAGRIQTVSYGKERPLEVCSDPSCLIQNRRAITVVTPGAGV